MNTQIKSDRLALSGLRILCLSMVCVLWASGTAFGLQAHATPEEGLYSHQLGHLFFILSMVIFAFWLQKTRLVEKGGWRLLQISCLLFVLWNVDAMSGHEIEMLIEESRFVGPPRSRGLLVKDSLLPYLFFILKLDHLLCVPAMVLLFLGLGKLRTESPEGQP